jgi:hypothetical protein
MPRPLKPTDLLVANGWYLEGLVNSIGATIISPHFETLSGLQKTANSVEIVDAGTNKKHKFPTQILDFGELTLTRTDQANNEDIIMATMADDMILRGLKIPQVQLVKLHHQQEIFRIILFDFRISAYTYPDFDIASEDKFIISYTATIDDWLRIPTGYV